MGKMSDFRTGMKQRQAAQAVAEEKPVQPPPKVEKPAKPQKQDKPGQVVFQCGHEKPVRAFLSQPCAECRDKLRKAKTQRKREARAGKEVVHDGEGGRLPDGATFKIEPYDAAAKCWRGALTIGANIFTGQQSGVMRLLKELDAQYRKHLAFIEAAAK